MSDRTYPALRWAAITPGTGAIEPTPVSVYCGVAGTVTAEGSDGNSEDFIVTAGQVLPIQPVRITAGPASLVALYN